MTKHDDLLAERRLLNDAIQFWKGYLEAIIWISTLELSEETKEKLNTQHEVANVEFESLKIRWRELSIRKKNARRNKRN